MQLDATWEHRLPSFAVPVPVARATDSYSALAYAPKLSDIAVLSSLLDDPRR